MNIINEIRTTSAFYNADVFKNWDEEITYRQFIERFSDDASDSIVECMVVIQPSDTSKKYHGYGDAVSIAFMMIVYLDNSVEKVIRVDFSGEDIASNETEYFGRIYDVVSGYKCCLEKNEIADVDLIDEEVLMV